MARSERFIFLLLSWLVFSSPFARAESSSSDLIQFRADYHQRDLSTNTAKGKGHVWVKRGDKQLWADEIEIDFGSGKAVANGNVHVREGKLDVWATHATYAFNGEEATFLDATVISNQLVLSGTTIKKLSRDKFEVDEGSYTNCNTDLTREKEAANCPFDWKVYGRNISVTVEGYAQLHDALVYVKRLPVFYTPIFVFPVKTERQSGILNPQFTSQANLGSGFTLPVYLALGPWHDLTLTPTYYSETGYHVGVNYRYLYSPVTNGYINTFFTRRRFGTFENPELENKERSRLLGFIGEGAVDASNQVALGGRMHTRQLVRLVSNPYFTYDYYRDFSFPTDVAALRSQVSFTAPSDDYLFTAQARYHQSLVMSKDTGVDKGAVTQLPQIYVSKVNRPLLSKYLSYEFDTDFNHFYRARDYDQVPATRLESGVNVDADPELDGNDYIRTGMRMQVEPRLIANVPMPPGFQFQPVLKAGSLGYRFTLPQSEVLHREYLTTELPLSMYLSRTFDTTIKGFEKMSHVFQPRLIFAESLYQSGDPTHQFFYRNMNGLSSPRFDILDQVVPFQYGRVELINRVSRKINDRAERFFLMQISNQVNFRTSEYDPRYKYRLGPMEFLAELRLWRLYAQIQANYQLQLTNGVRENDLSSTLTYANDEDAVSVGTRFQTRALPNPTEQTLLFSFTKSLPIAFNLSGASEYSLLRGELLSYSAGFHFEQKPRSCWGLTLRMGRNSYKQPFVLVDFRFNFGSTNDARSL